MLLHNTLDVLPSNSDDAFVVLIRHMERDRSRHFLLHKHETLLHGLVAGSHNIDVEIVLVETVKDDLNIACGMLVSGIAGAYKTTYSDP